MWKMAAMKPVLYIFLCFFLQTIRSQTGDTNYYDILYDFNEDDKLVEMKIDSKTSLKSMKLENFAYDSSLPLPLAVKVVFTIDKFQKSCLFSIEDDEEVRLALCFTPVGPNIMNIVLKSYSFPMKEIVYENYMVTMDDQIKFLFYMTEDKYKLYVDCGPTYEENWLGDLTLDELILPRDAILYIGRTELLRNMETFQGTASEIKIYYKTEFNNICEDEIKFPASLEEEYDDVGRFTGGDDSVPAEKGEKGEKGDKGLKGEPGNSKQGPPGLIGPEGPIGPPGRPGQKGELGDCKCSESVVSSLLKKMPEMRGPPGEAGPRGDTGDPGLEGMTGKPGQQGERGPEGLKGERGEKGDEGIPGRDGAEGQKGEPGSDGKQGPPGIQGIQGPPGPPGIIPEDTDLRKEIPIAGPRGEQGPIGPPGFPGLQGSQGQKGEKGQEGMKGQKGERGNTGAQGPRGEKGDRGEMGQDGTPGVPGTHGKHGERGEKGEPGLQGETGEPGRPAKLSSILTSEVDPSEKEEIVQLLRGVKGEQGSLGPKGDKGEPGLMGLAGNPGRDGEHGRHGAKGERGAKGDEGPMGPQGPKGDAGPPGPAGLPSNIDASVLKGAEGKPGPPGPPGSPGKTGPKGERGHRGYNGAKGQRGATGPAGAAGPVGRPGKDGARGEKGDKGDSATPINLKELKGDKGDRGDTGSTGSPGAPGPPGFNASCTCPEAKTVIGPPGPQGPPGRPGPPGTSVIGPKGEPGGMVSQKTFYAFADEPAYTNDVNEDDDFYTAGTVIYKSTTALVKRAGSTRPGTLAYVLQEKILLLRVDGGWRYVSMGSLMYPDSVDDNSIDIPHVTSHKPYYPTATRRHEVSIEGDHTTSSPVSHDSEYGKYMVSPLEPSNRTGSRKKTGIRIAALNEPYSGRMISNLTRKSASYECHRQSLAYNGTFSPFLSKQNLDISNIVHRNDRHLPVRNLREELLFHSWTSVFDGSGATLSRPNAHIYSFDSKNVMTDSHIWPEKAIWHGSTPNGKVNAADSCNKWESENPHDYGMASSLWKHKLLDQERYPCNNKLIVLCIEVTSKNVYPKRKRKRHTPPSQLQRQHRHSSSRTDWLPES